MKFSKYIFALFFVFLLVEGVLFAQGNFRILPFLQVNQNQIQIRWFASSNYSSSIVLKDAQGNQLISNQVSGVEVSNLYYTQAEKNQTIVGLEGVNWIGGDKYFKYEKVYTLPANQTFLYSVTLNGETYSSSFHTAPDTQDWDSIRFIALSDSETEPRGRVTNRAWYPGNPLLRLYPVPSGWKNAFGSTTEQGIELPNYLLSEKDGFAENLKILKSRNPDFVLMPGDLVQGGGYMPGWDEFWRHTAGEFDQVFDKFPIIPSIGNWETFGALNGGYGTNERGDFNPLLGRSRFHTFFEFPTTDPDQKHRQSYYRTDYGPITILTLDSSNGTPEQSRSDFPADQKLTGTTFTDIGTDTQENFTQSQYEQAGGTDLSGFGPGTPQYTWLEKNLIKAKEEGRLIFVQFHHIPYSSGEHGIPINHELATGQEGLPLRVLHPLLEEYGVIAVFAGHDELFERSFVDEDSDGKGVHYYDVGVAGDGMRGVKRDWYNNPLNPLGFNTYSQWVADLDSKEEWDNSSANPVLLDGGKHYGHLEVNLKKIQDGGKTYAQIDFEPVYSFPVMNNQYQLQRVERRVYNDPVRILVELTTTADPVIEPDFKSSFQVALNSEGFIITSVSNFFNTAPENDWDITLSRSEIFSCSDLGVQPVTVTVKNGTGQEWSQVVSVVVVDDLAPDFEATDAYLAFDKTIGVVNLSPDDFYIRQDYIFENCLGAGGVTIDLDRTSISCADFTEDPIPVKITVIDKSGNFTVKTRKVYLNAIESKKVTLTASGDLIEGNTVELSLGDELDYEVAYWKRIASIGLETFPDSTAKSIRVDQAGQYVAVLNLTNGCQVESEWLVVESISVAWPELKSNIQLVLGENSQADLNPADVFTTWPVEGVSVSFSKSKFGCENLGSNQVTAVLSHPDWGQKEETITLQIVDLTSPILVVQTPQLTLDRILGALQVDVNDFVKEISDNCEVSSLEISPTLITCEQIGKVVEFEITATDPSGNTTKKQVSVSIEDTQSKTLSLKAVQSGPYYAGELVELRLGEELDFVLEGWYKNGQKIEGEKGNSILVENSGSYFAKVYPTDACLISSEIVEVNFQVPDFGEVYTEKVLNLNQNGKADLAVSEVFKTWPLPTGFTATLSQNQFTCDDLGVNQVTVLIKNDKGTTWERTVSVLIKDLIAPVLSVSSKEVFLDVTKGSLEIPINDLIEAVSDNCGIKEISPAKVTFTCEDLAKTKLIKVTAIDFSGNKTEVNAEVRVSRKEEVAPVLEGSTLLCEGEEGVLEVVAEGQFEVVAWRRNGTPIQGQTGKTLSISEAGEYQALIRYQGACLSETSKVEVIVNSKPNGEIQVDGNILRAPEGYQYQWYRNGEKMEGKTNRVLTVDSMGEYKVLLTSEAGCEAYLAPVTLTISGLALPWTSLASDLKIYPNPAKHSAVIELEAEAVPAIQWLKIYSSSGKEVTSLMEITSLDQRKFELRFGETAPGVYLLTWIDPSMRPYFGRLIILK